jgi:cyclopropane fatty-acyl-phospholipid synthase-like methyltransferase
MLDKKYPWNNQKEFYDVQSKDLFTHIDELPFYHVSVVGESGEQFAKYLIKESGVDKQSRVVDMGCGAGYFVNKLSEFCYVEGISDSEECIKYAKLNFPDNIFKVENMEVYKGKDITHCFFLESLFYSNIENTFKNVRNTLVDGGVLFIKELFDVSSNEYQVINKEHWGKYHVYYPHTVDKVIEVAENNGFELIESKDLLQIMNPAFWQNSFKYHSQDVPLYKEIYSNEEGGWPYISPYQLKFKKKITLKN